MANKLINGIIYTVIDDVLGPNPEVWIPKDFDENATMRISIKTVTLLTGEEEIPEGLIIVPFTSIKKKGLVKYLQWNDESRRGGIGRSVITLLFNEYDDLIFYKYIKDLELEFDECAKKILEVEVSKADKGVIQDVILKFQECTEDLLEEYRNKELSPDEIEAFKEEESELPEDYDYRFKIVICGDPEVGKTSIVLRFSDRAFKRTYMPTIGVNISEKNILVGDILVQLVIWDIAGQEKFKKMRKHFYQGSEALFSVFDLTKFSSFNNSYNWYKDIVKHIEEGKKLNGFLLGNKNDLVEERDVKKEGAEKLADELNLEYIETSALTGANVELAFYKIAKSLLESKKN